MDFWAIIKTAGVVALFCLGTGALCASIAAASRNKAQLALLYFCAILPLKLPALLILKHRIQSGEKALMASDIFATVLVYSLMIAGTFLYGLRQNRTKQ
jgi:hypothetical protein